MNNKEKPRNIYIDVLRIMATAAVLLIHTAAQHWGDEKIPFLTWNVLNIWDAILQWTVPVFIMISGALYLNRSYVISIKKLYSRSIFRVVMACFCWSFIYAIYQVHIEGGGFARILALTLDGHYHLWFLYMIVSLYIITPLLKKLSEEDLKYLLIVSLILCFLIPSIMEIKNAVKPFIGNDMISKALDQIFSPYIIFMKYLKIDYVAYYILGHFLHEREFNAGELKLLYSLSVVSFIFTPVFSAIITFFGKQPYGIYGIFTVNMLLESIGVFVLVKQSCLKHGSSSGKTVKIITLLSGCCFGIYLVHALLLEILQNEFSIDSLSFNPFLSVPIIAFFVFLVSLGITVIIKKIPLANKYMV